jgi:phosphoesterase RecJ-like protein
MNKNIVDLINKNQEFILTSHVNPDGDSIGSELALFLYLKSLGKNVNIINYSATPENYKFLDKLNSIQIFDEKTHSNSIESTDVIFILDTNEYERIRTMAPFVKKSNAIKIVIDHHLGFNENDFDFSIIDINSPATAEILFRFFKYIEDLYSTEIINYDIAEALYTAIMTDTGSFRFDRTTSQTHLIAAELLNYGVNPFEIYDKVYNQSSIGKLHLLGRFLNNIEILYNGSTAVSYVMQSDFEQTQTDEYAIEGFSSHLLSIEKVILGIILTQTKRGVKISFRSKANVHSNLLAKKFGGGGHKYAAGTFIPGADLFKIKNEVISEAVNFLS